jgi:DNA polymerase III delta subunit
MITLIHGDFTEASRNELNRLKGEHKGKEIRQINGGECTETILIQSLESTSLFGNETVVIIENLFGKLGRKVKLIQKLAEIIKRSQQNTQIILWENKEIGKTVIGSLGANLKISEFKISVLIFKFLDTLAPKNSAQLLDIYDKLQKQDAPELIFTMIVKRIRQLLQLADGTIPDGLPSWQAGRLTTQARQFTLEKLMVMYKRLLDIEYSIKSGNSAYDMSHHIELFLIDL